MHWRLACTLMAPLLLLPPQGAAAQSTLRGVSNRQEALPDDATPPPLAADGYCVVALRDQKQWLRGDPRLAAQFDGRQYLFSGPRERQIFVAAPIEYAPVLSGDCPVTLAESGQRMAGKVEFGVVQSGRLHFFASAEAREKFVADPAAYANADLADNGKCLVSRVEYGRDVAGLPETAVVVNGMRRLFAGAYEQRLYLQQPGRYDAVSSAPPASSAAPSAGDAVGPLAGGWRPSTAGESPTGEPSADAPADEISADGSAGGSRGAEPGIHAEPVMGGYCPVTLKTKGLWVRGRYDNRAVLGDLVFLTAGPAEQETFLADPTPFIPALGGDCPVSLVDFGEKVRGSTFHSAEYHGRLYFFADTDQKEAFRAQPERYASIDVAADGACVVTLKELGESRPGFAEFAAWHDGLLYRFVGPEEKAKFLTAPNDYMAPNDEPAASEPAAQPSVAQ
jgi:YHS domain-containing protein